MTIVLAQNLFAIALTLGAMSTLTGLILQWRRTVDRRFRNETSKFRSSAAEAVFVAVGAALVVGALALTGIAYF